MRRFKILCLLVVLLLAVHLATPEVTSASWGCGAAPPQCTFGGPDSQCDAICGAGWGVCERPGCCACLA